MAETKASLLSRGRALAEQWCRINGIVCPDIIDAPSATWRVGACAYYRPVTIRICSAKCAGIGGAGRAWSYPGYVVDRTPYGVIQHELGHHVDWTRGTTRGAYWSDYGESVKAASGEAAITSYCPDPAEWFAEVFRLFVTNPDLLRRIRPKAFARLIADGMVPVFEDTWRDRLTGAPDRTIAAALNKFTTP